MVYMVGSRSFEGIDRGGDGVKSLINLVVSEVISANACLVEDCLKLSYLHHDSCNFQPASFVAKLVV